MWSRVNVAAVTLLLLGWICIAAVTAEIEDAQNGGTGKMHQSSGGGGGGVGQGRKEKEQPELGPVSQRVPGAAASVLDRAAGWLDRSRARNAGWANDTALGLLGLRLYNLTRDRKPTATAPLAPPCVDLLFQTSAKQLELEIVLLIWKHRDFETSPVRSAFYTLALNAMCMDPRQFHGHDLIGTMQHHEPLSDYEFAVTSLAACSAQVHIRKRQMRRLLDIAHTAQDHNIETVVMTVLTLRCIVQDHRHRNLQHFLQKPLISLVQRQRQDGSFGDARSTALALQALGSEPFEKWNRTATVAWLAGRQRPDGSFDADVRTTAEVVLGLVPRGLVNIRTLDCDAGVPGAEPPPDPQPKVALASAVYTKVEEVTIPEKRENATTPAPLLISSSQSNPQMINVSYTLWVGSDISKIYNLTLSAPKNVTFYEIMVLAAQRSANFEFSAYEWPNGHYVHTLAGYKEEPLSYHYWLLYRLPSLPEPSSPPGNQFVAPGGVDDLQISVGEHYLFWYKKL